MTVTYFQNIYDDKPIYLNAVSVLKKMREENSYSELLRKIETTADKEERNELKKELPVICFNGKFTKRRKEGLVKGSGLIILDFDEGDEESLRESRKKLEGWNCTFSCFSSPSGNGRFKALIRIPRVDNDNDFKKFFHFFEEKYKIDPSGKDISRASFLSTDKELYLNENAKEFTWEMLKKYGTQPQRKTTDQKLLDTIANWMSFAPQGERQHTACKVGYYSGGLCATGTLSEAEVLPRLMSAAEQRGGEVDQSKRAIKESFEQGKLRPILDIQEIERKMRSMKPKRDPKSFIVSNEEIDSEAEAYYEGDGAKRYLTEIPELDQYLSWRPNCFSYAVGGKGAGKTTLKLYIDTFFAKKYQLKSLILSFENDAMELQDEVIGFLTGNNASWVFKNNRSLFNKARDFFHEYFTVLKFPPDYNFMDIIEAAQSLNSQSKYHQLWIDPLFKLAGTDDYSQNKLIARNAEPFANEVMSLFITAHPTGSKQREKGHSDDLSGEFGAMYSNAADITYGISRDYQNASESVRNTVNLSIEKVRSKKLHGGRETVTTKVTNPVTKKEKWEPCPIRFEYKWKEHSYNIFVPRKENPNIYTQHIGGLLHNHEKSLF